MNVAQLGSLRFYLDRESDTHATSCLLRADCIFSDRVCRKQEWELIRRVGLAWESINSERRLREAFCAKPQDRHRRRSATEALRLWFHRRRQQLQLLSRPFRRVQAGR